MADPKLKRIVEANSPAKGAPKPLPPPPPRPAPWAQHPQQAHRLPGAASYTGEKKIYPISRKDPVMPERHLVTRGKGAKYQAKSANLKASRRLLHGVVDEPGRHKGSS